MCVQTYVRSCPGSLIAARWQAHRAGILFLNQYGATALCQGLGNAQPSGRAILSGQPFRGRKHIHQYALEPSEQLPIQELPAGGRKLPPAATSAERGGLALVEEAFHALRRAPLGLLATYYLGALPFVLSLLYFWADMSRSAFAARRLFGASLGLALLFVWMKVCQAYFAAGMHAHTANRPAPPINLKAFLTLAFLQGVLQPTGFVLLPLASLVTLPAAWCYAFYQSILVPTPAEAKDVASLVSKAAAQARLWPRQNHVALALLSLVGIVVFMNLTIGLFFAPFLLKQLTGIETVFTRSSYYTFNSTLMAVAAGGTYLLVDPLIKTLYALRCHYGESLSTADDLRADLRRCQALRGLLPLLLAICLVAPLGAGIANADQALPVTPDAVDQAVSKTLTQRKFAWRFPRSDKPEEAEVGAIAAFFEGLIQTMKRWVSAVADMVRAFLDWLRDLFPKRRRDPRDTLKDWMGSTHMLAFGLLALAVTALVVLLWQRRRRRKSASAEAIAAQPVPLPDLAQEFVRADEHLTDEWLTLAAELMERGEYRLALRAVYLASLAMLARHSMITIAKHKSNLDYQHELARRVHAIPEVGQLFRRNVNVFDRVWYGMHPATESDISPFIVAVQQMEEYVAQQ